jgi:hypothetical protein
VKRSQIIALVVLVACMASVSAFAAVSGGAHDMRGWTGNSGDGQYKAYLCEACHAPHNAGSTALWSQTVVITGGFSAVQNLCFTCHDGTITDIGSLTAFSTSLETHATPAGNDCSGGVDSCHDVHNNDNGKFIDVALDAGSGTYCVTCHGTGTALAGGDHLLGSMHYTDGTNFNCNSCHTPHGAAIQTGGYPQGDMSANKKVILRTDNFAGGEYGTMCNACHSNQAPYTSVVGDVAVYRETQFDGTEAKHPTFTTSPTGNWTTAMSGCNVCHDVHNAGGAVTGNGAGSFLLAVENTNSASCTGCHDGALAPDYDGGGGGSHFVGDVATTSFAIDGNPATLPWADELDEDGQGGVVDFAGNTADFMTCETCHSVHKKGFVGTGQNVFLRHANGAANAICTDCHTQN